MIGAKIRGLERVLEIAVAAADETGLGYLGADVVTDALGGPMILELNARPGLAIQLANGAGLRPRLEAVDAYLGPIREREKGRGGRGQGDVELCSPVEERVALGRRIAGSAERSLGASQRL